MTKAFRSFTALTAAARHEPTRVFRGFIGENALRVFEANWEDRR